MPRYPYVCQACEHRFEVFQKMSDAKLVECPECQAPKLERLITGGTGYYFRGGYHGEKGLDYKEQSRADVARRDPEKFDRIVERDKIDEAKAKAKLKKTPEPPPPKEG